MKFSLLPQTATSWDVAKQEASNLSVRTVVKLCTFGSFKFRGELGFLNCDDICMCVVNKLFELLAFF